MLHSEMDVLIKIRNCSDPELAMQIATDIILSHLALLESSHKQSAALPQESCAAG